MKIKVFYDAMPFILVPCIGINMSEGEDISNLRNVGISLTKCIEVHKRRNIVSSFLLSE
jgi:hypothetical protein